MKTIQKHTHADRISIAKSMVPGIKKMFGSNLVAIAVRGSTAKNTDGPYSDLELFAFIRKMPEDQKYKPYGKLRKIVDGLLIELIWVTPDTYLSQVKDISPAWFGSGADYLLPLFESRIIQTLNAFKPENKEKKCLDQAAALWDHLQEAATKVLNAALAKNKSGMPLVMGDLFSNMLKMVSFLNAKPYTTFAQLVTESRKMKYRPKDFEKLTKLIVNGEYGKCSEIFKLVYSVMEEFEQVLLEAGYTLDARKPLP
ncbi:MAG: kanamycin nucleotidyltransferase C-terminal domain-containing protein [Patescibacteria group bacterium]